MQSDVRDYRPDLPMPELIAVIRGLLEEQRRVERLVCRYLADLADRVDARGCDVLGGYGDIHHASRCLFGLSVRRTRESVRMGRALRRLPHIEKAFVAGEVGYSRVREVTRVARPDDELHWLRLACQLPMRILERRVAEAGGTKASEERTDPAASVTWASPDTIELRVSLRAESWALMQRAMEGARRSAEGDALLGDADALAAVARDALAQQATDTDSADLRRTVVLYECTSCTRTEVETGVGPIEIGEASAAALGCGAPVVKLESAGRIERRGGPMPSAVARAVRLRDRDRCRVPGCRRRRYVDVHHLDPRSRGGVHSRKNCLCLCTTHHRMLHEGNLVITGDPEAAIDFHDGAGAKLIDPLAATKHDGVTQPGASGFRAPDGHRLLSTMGNRGGWTVDDLCEATKLPPATVTSTLLLFELGGQVCADLAGRYRALQ
jgi:hypothetical protein